MLRVPRLLVLASVCVIAACGSPPMEPKADAPAAAPAAAPTPAPEAMSVTGKPLYAMELANRAELEANLSEGRSRIWPRRPTAPTPSSGSDGVRAICGATRTQSPPSPRASSAFPTDARFYRHRGHRYITVRNFDGAVADFEKAVTLIKGKPDEIEPDGAPNAAGKPRSSLQFNIWYHLGLAYYLKGDYANAKRAYDECMKVSTNDDSITATSDWQWMTYMRLGDKAAAAKVLERITPKMDILENGSYHKRLLMYKGLEKVESLLDTTNADDLTVATQGYGVGNYYFVTGDTAKAKEVFDRVLAGKQWAAFGYIAAEVDRAKMN